MQGISENFQWGKLIGNMSTAEIAVRSWQKRLPRTSVTTCTVYTDFHNVWGFQYGTIHASFVLCLSVHEVVSEMVAWKTDGAAGAWKGDVDKVFNIGLRAWSSAVRSVCNYDCSKNIWPKATQAEHAPKMWQGGCLILESDLTTIEAAQVLAAYPQEIHHQLRGMEGVIVFNAAWVETPTWKKPWDAWGAACLPLYKHSLSMFFHCFAICTAMTPWFIRFVTARLPGCPEWWWRILESLQTHGTLVLFCCQMGAKKGHKMDRMACSAR